LLTLIAFRILIDVTTTHAEHKTAGTAIRATNSTPSSDLNNTSLNHLANNNLLSIWKIDD
jgi:hypothetical protein